MKRLLKVSTLFVLMLLTSSISYGASGDYYVVSPNQNVRFSVFLVKKQLSYNVTFKDKMVSSGSGRGAFEMEKVEVVVVRREEEEEVEIKCWG